MGRESKDAKAKMVLPGLILLAFALRVCCLDFQSLWRDEVDTVIFAQRGIPALVANFVRTGENGPLYFLALHHWISLTGISEFSLRFFSVAFGVLTVPLVYLFGRRLLDGSVGLLAAFLVALSPYHVWYSQEARMYSLVAFLALLSLHLFHLALQRDQWLLWVGYVVVTSLALYIHLFTALMILVEGVWFGLLWRGYRDAARNALIALACLTLPYVPIAVRHIIPALVSPPPIVIYYPYGLTEMMRILLTAFSLGLRPITGLGPIVLFASLFLAGLFYRGEGTRKWRALLPSWRIALLCIYVFLPILATYLVSLRRPTFTDRYLIFILPGYYLLLASGLLVVKRRSAIVFALCISLVTFYALRAVWMQDHTRIKADFRAAAQHFAAHAQPDDLIIFLMPYVHHAFSYYHPEEVHWADPPYTNSGMGEEEVADAMEKATMGYARVWLFLSEANFWDSSGLVEGWFRDNAQLVDKSCFSYIELHCYSMGKGD